MMKLKADHRFKANAQALEYDLRVATNQTANPIGRMSVERAFLSLKALAPATSPAAITYATKSPSTGAPYFDTET